MSNAPRPDSMVIWGNVLTFCNRGVVASAACRVLLGDCYGRSEESWGCSAATGVASPAHAQAAMGMRGGGVAHGRSVTNRGFRKGPGTLAAESARGNGSAGA